MAPSCWCAGMPFLLVYSAHHCALFHRLCFLSPAAGQMSKKLLVPPVAGADCSSADWHSHAVEASLGGRGLTRLAHLGRLTCLVRLCLARNFLASATGLAACSALEELDLADNLVGSIGAQRCSDCWFSCEMEVGLRTFCRQQPYSMSRNHLSLLLVHVHAQAIMA